MSLPVGKNGASSVCPRFIPIYHPRFIIRRTAHPTVLFVSAKPRVWPLPLFMRLESFCILAARSTTSGKWTDEGSTTRSRKETVQSISCLRCRREIEAGDKSVAVYMFAQTVGVRPRQKSGAQRICFCPQCAVSLAMGLPPEGALNMAAWDMIRDLVSSEPSLNEAAWEGLRGVVGLLGTGEDTRESGKFRRAG